MVGGREARGAGQGGGARARVVAVASRTVYGQSYVAVELPLPGRGGLSIQSGSQGGGWELPPGEEKRGPAAAAAAAGMVGRPPTTI